MSKVRNLLGLKVNYLTVVEYAGLTNDKKAQWKCKCVCGNFSIVRSTNLTRPGRKTQSCGCQKGQRVYGPIPLRLQLHLLMTKEQSAWKAMHNRCYNEDYPQYKDYGGRGIIIKFESFEDFFDEIGEAPGPEYSVGRINNDKSYEKGNIRWETRKQQQRNMRSNRLLNYKGKTQTIIEWAEELGLNETYISHRLARGWSVERAIEEPIIPRK